MDFERHAAVYAGILYHDMYASDLIGTHVEMRSLEVCPAVCCADLQPDIQPARAKPVVTFEFAFDLYGRVQACFATVLVTAAHRLACVPTETCSGNKKSMFAGPSLAIGPKHLQTQLCTCAAGANI